MECNRRDRSRNVSVWREYAMRFALWRKGMDRKPPSNMVSAPVAASPSAAPLQPGDLDVRAIWRVLLRKKRAIIIPTLLAFVLSLAVVNLITPRSKSEARI